MRNLAMLVLRNTQPHWPAESTLTMAAMWQERLPHDEVASGMWIVAAG
jgi:hypothetical protein